MAAQPVSMTVVAAAPVSAAMPKTPTVKATSIDVVSEPAPAPS